MMGEPTPVRTLIVDDEALARRRLHVLLSGIAHVEIVGEASSGSEAIVAIRDLQPHVVLLDIQMPGVTGFDVLTALSGMPRLPVVIFVTAHDEHALKAFEFEAVDYVLKPVIEERLVSAMKRASARVREQSQPEIARQLAALLKSLGDSPPAHRELHRLAIRTEGRVHFVATDDVVWIAADGDLVKIHAGAAVHTMRSTLTKLEAVLNPDRFARVHRSLIVNVNRVREIQPWFKGDYVLVMQDGTKLRSGRSYRTAVQGLISNALTGPR